MHMAARAHGRGARVRSCRARCRACSDVGLVHRQAARSGCVKVAYFSPLPPSTSGIADYSALLLPPLERLVEVDVVRPGRTRPVGDADVSLYHVGNNPDGHAYLAALEREAGVPARLLGYGVLEGRVPPLWEVRPEEFPLAGEVLDRATGLIVHSRYVEEHARDHGYNG